MSEGMAQVRLSGGRTGGAVRVGGTVRRARGAWTPAVHALLDHLAQQGVSLIPKVLADDSEGREVLTYLPGYVPTVDGDDGLTDGQLASLARWLRGAHAAVSGWTHAGPWRFFGAEAVATHIVHNDLSPSNVCFDGDRLAGVVDWDLAGPSTPVLDLAQLAWACVPLGPGATGSAEQAAARLRIIADAYGAVSAQEILDAVPARVQIMRDGIVEAVRRGDVGMTGLLAGGEVERGQAALQALAEITPRIRSLLH